MADMRDDLLHDKRLVKRHLERGFITREQLDQRLTALPDCAERAAPMQVQLESVGVRSVERKQTGDQE